MKKQRDSKKKVDYKKELKGKPRKVSSKEVSDKLTDKEDRKDSSKGWNHPSWYIPDENIRKTVGSFSFSQTLGVPYLLSGDAPMLSLTYDYNQKIPTVMAIKTFPYPGDDSGANQYYAIPAISTAARKLYTAISAVNSKTTQYTAPTLAKAILCVGDLISLISHAQRAIGIAFTYNPRNREVPRQLLEAMGFNADSILDNLPLFRNQLNTVITMANNIRMPKSIAYFDKCWSMYSDVYEDTDSAMSQYYVMSPQGYLILDETNTPSDVAWTDFPASMTWSSYISIIKNVVKALLDSTTLNYVFTDVINYTLKQGGDLIGFAYVPELYSILPQYDQTFLTQVHNMTWGYFDLSNYVISEDVINNILTTTNIFKYKIGTHTNQAVTLDCGDSILDLPFTDNPTADDLIDALAFKTIIDNPDDTTGTTGDPYKIWEHAIPDHPVYDVIMYNSEGTTFSSAQASLNLDIGINTISTVFWWNVAFSAYDVKPIRYAFDSTNAQLWKHYVGTLNFSTTINVRQLRMLFDWYFLGLFDAEVKEVHSF